MSSVARNMPEKMPPMPNIKGAEAQLVKDGQKLKLSYVKTEAWVKEYPKSAAEQLAQASSDMPSAVEKLIGKMNTFRAPEYAFTHSIGQITAMSFLFMGMTIPIWVPKISPTRCSGEA